MPTRRDAIATGAGFVAAATSAGCLELLFGEGLSFEATAPSVAQAALDETGYRENRITDYGVQREFEAAGQSREVAVTNWQAEYDKSVDLADLGLSVESASQRAAVFSVLSSPRVEVAGESFNPLEDMDAAQIVSQVQSRYEGIDGLQRVGEQSVTLLGTTTTATEFQGDLELQNSGATVDVTLFVTRAVASGADFVLAVGAYPTALSSERENVSRLLEGIRHEG